MSYIPNHAMPHAYADDYEEGEEQRRERAPAAQPSALMIGGAALLGYLLYRALR